MFGCPLYFQLEDEVQDVKVDVGKNNSVQHKTKSMLLYYLFLLLNQQWLKVLMTHAGTNIGGRNVFFKINVSFYLKDLLDQTIICRVFTNIK